MRINAYMEMRINTYNKCIGTPMPMMQWNECTRRWMHGAVYECERTRTFTQTMVNPHLFIELQFHKLTKTGTAEDRESMHMVALELLDMPLHNSKNTDCMSVLHKMSDV